MKRWMYETIFLLLLTAAALFPETAQAAEIASGSCGDDVTWVLTDDGILTISGTGPMWGSGWSDYRDDITAVIIESGVTSIGGSAFSGCGNLMSVEIPESVTVIGDSAFDSCNRLTAIDIPATVTEIGTYAFYGCNSLKTIDIPEGVSGLGSSIFRDCTSLTSVTIPMSVTEIGTYAFYGCEKLKTIDIPAGVTKIGNSAFYDCSSLTSVSIPDGVTTLAESLFQGCNSLASVMIPDSVTEIGVDAFASCKSLIEIDIPEGVTEIGAWAFSGCTGLTDIDLPAGVTEISDGEFSNCSSLASVMIPDGVTQIGESAFSSCDSLTEIDIPEGVTVIGDGAFSGCEKLTSITLPTGITEIGGQTFSYCLNLVAVEIPNGVTTLGVQAFSGCESLTTITIPSSVTTVADEAFRRCYSLESVTFLGDAPEIGDGVFSGIDTTPGRFCIYYTGSGAGWTAPTWNGYPSACIDPPGEYSQLDDEDRNAQGILFTLNEESLTATVGTNTDDENNAGYTGASGGTVIVPDSVIKGGKTYRVIGISQNAFSGNRFLREIELGASVSSIDPSAFADCPLFVAFSVGEGNHNYSALDGVLFDAIQYYLYVYPAGKTQTAYTVPDTVRTIGQYAFRGAEALQSVVVPDQVTSIGAGAFSGCTGIREITLPFIGGSRDDNRPFSHIWEFSYRDTPVLETVVITDEGLKGDDFSGSRYDYVSTLRSITLPTCGTEIPDRSFEGCSALEELIFQDVGTVMDDGVLTIPSQVTAIGEGAFSQCEGIRQVTLPASVTELGYEAFSLCTGIESFSVAEDNPNYSSDKWGVLFSKDRSELIQYPSSRIWPYYNVPDETKVIDEYAFYACGNLVNLYIPETVSDMEYRSVYQCPGVTLCVKLDSPADDYAGENDLTAWYIENYTLQGLEIYQLPEKTVFAMGEEDFSSLYVTAVYGGKRLQAENYTISYDSKQSGVQTVTVSSEGKTAEFDILLYNDASESLLSFDGISELVDGACAFAAIYDENGKMLCLRTASELDGAAKVVVPRTAAARMAEGKLFQLQENTWAPVSATDSIS